MAFAARQLQQKRLQHCWEAWGVFAAVSEEGGASRAANQGGGDNKARCVYVHCTAWWVRSVPLAGSKGNRGGEAFPGEIQIGRRKREYKLRKGEYGLKKGEPTGKRSDGRIGEITANPASRMPPRSPENWEKRYAPRPRALGVLGVVVRIAMRF